MPWSTSSGVILPSPLVWLKFNNNLNDSSGNGNNFTAGGSVTYTTGAGGLTNGAARFVSGAYANSTANINYGAGHNVITVCVWLYQDTFGSGDNLLLESSVNSNGNDGTFMANPNSSGTSAFDLNVHDSGTNSKNFTRPSAAAWHHYSIVYDDTTTTGLGAKVYVDSVLTSTSQGTNTKTNTSTVFLTTTLYLMCRGGASLFNTGSLDDLRIYTRELIQPEVNAVYADIE